MNFPKKKLQMAKKIIGEEQEEDGDGEDETGEEELKKKLEN